MAVATCVGAHIASAQVATGAATDAGRIEQRFTPQRPRLEPGLPQLPAVPLPAPEPPAKAGSFMLAAIDITGATVYQASALVPIYEPFLGHMTDRAGVQKIVEAITAKYRGDGYFLTRAEAPPQDLALGILHIKIVEGFIADVTFEGIAEDEQATVRAIAAPITHERPARLATLERALLLIRDIPGVSINPRLELEDPASGRFGLIVDIRRKTVDAALHLDNRGTSLVGPLEQTATAAINGLLIDNSRTRVAVATTPAHVHELQYGEVAEDIGLRTDGTRLLLDASLGMVRSAGSPSDSDIKTRNTVLEARLSHPLIRSNAQTLRVAIGFDDESAEQFQPQPSSYHDELRVIRISSTEQIVDGWGGANLIGIQVSQGLDILGASSPNQPNVSRSGGRDDFTKVNLTLARHQTLTADWALQLAAVAQRSRTPLFLAEQFGLGGAQFGRAFDPSEITGDDGEAGSVELQDTYATDYAFLPWIQYFTFFDGGATTFHSLGTPDTQTLASTGLGVRVRVYRNYSGEFLAAFPIVQHVTNGNPRKGNSLYFDINAGF